MKSYGKELILDLHECDASTFTRKNIRAFFKGLCKRIEMEPATRYWWDDLYTPTNEKETEPHLVGTSAVQFIKTSNITIHTLDIMRRLYLNVFSCKDFDADAAIRVSQIYFRGIVVSSHVIERR